MTATILFVLTLFCTVTASTFLVTSFMDAMETTRRQRSVDAAGRPRSAYYPDGWTLNFHRDDDYSVVYNPLWHDSVAACPYDGFQSDAGCILCGWFDGCYVLHPTAVSSSVAEYTFDRDYHAGIALSLALRSPYTRVQLSDNPTLSVYFTLIVDGETMIHNHKAPPKEDPFTYKLRADRLVSKGSTVVMKAWCGPNGDPTADSLTVNLAIEAQCSDSRAISGVTGTRCASSPTYLAPTTSGPQQVTNCPYEDIMCDAGNTNPLPHLTACHSVFQLADATGKLTGFWTSDTLVGTYGRFKLWQRDTVITWHEARDACVANGGWLATDVSEESHAALSAVPGAGSYRSFVGGSDSPDEGIWRWVTGPAGRGDGGRGQVFFKAVGSECIGQMCFWEVSQPDNGRAVEHFLMVYATMEWNDVMPDISLSHYYCEYPLPPELPAAVAKDLVPHYPLMYQLFKRPGGISWNEARQLCSVYGGALATEVDASSKAHLTTIGMNLALNSETAFIGGSDYNQAGEWRWVTGTAEAEDVWKGRLFYTKNTDACSAPASVGCRWAASNPPSPVAGSASFVALKRTGVSTVEFVSFTQPAKATGFVCEFSFTATPTHSESRTATTTPTTTKTPTISLSSSQTKTQTLTNSPPQTPTLTSSVSPSPTTSNQRSATALRTATKPLTPTPVIPPTATLAATPSSSMTITPPPTNSMSFSSSLGNTATAEATLTLRPVVVDLGITGSVVPLLQGDVREVVVHLRSKRGRSFSNAKVAINVSEGKMIGVNKQVCTNEKRQEGCNLVCVNEQLLTEGDTMSFPFHLMTFIDVDLPKTIELTATVSIMNSDEIEATASLSIPTAWKEHKYLIHSADPPLNLVDFDDVVTLTGEHMDTMPKRMLLGPFVVHIEHVDERTARAVVPPMPGSEENVTCDVAALRELAARSAAHKELDTEFVQTILDTASFDNTQLLSLCDTASHKRFAWIPSDFKLSHTMTLSPKLADVGLTVGDAAMQPPLDTGKTQKILFTIHDVGPVFATPHNLHPKVLNQSGVFTASSVRHVQSYFADHGPANNSSLSPRRLGSISTDSNPMILVHEFEVNITVSTTFKSDAVQPELVVELPEYLQLWKWTRNITVRRPQIAVSFEYEQNYTATFTVGLSSGSTLQTPVLRLLPVSHQVAIIWHAVTNNCNFSAAEHKMLCEEDVILHRRGNVSEQAVFKVQAVPRSYKRGPANLMVEAWAENADPIVEFFSINPNNNSNGSGNGTEDGSSTSYDSLQEVTPQPPGNALSGGMDTVRGVFDPNNCAGGLHFIVYTMMAYLVSLVARFVADQLRRRKAAKNEIETVNVPAVKVAMHRHVWLGALVPCHCFCGTSHVHMLFAHLALFLAISTAFIEHFHGPFDSPIAKSIFVAAFSTVFSSLTTPVLNYYYTLSRETEVCCDHHERVRKYLVQADKHGFDEPSHPAAAGVSEHTDAD